MTNFRTLPPNAEIVKDRQLVTLSNMYTHFQGMPYYWAVTNTYNYVPPNYKTGEFYGDQNTKGLRDNLAYYGGVRYFRPGPLNLWSLTQGLGHATFNVLLDTLDFLHGITNLDGNPLKMLLVLNAIGGTADSFGNAISTVAHETYLVNYLTALFSSGGYFSTTSNSVSVGIKTFNLPPNLTLVDGYNVRMQRIADANVWVKGTITSYDGVTGDTVLNVTAVSGTGTGITDWEFRHLSPVLGYAIGEHPAFESVEVSNEQINNTTLSTTANQQALARDTRIAYQLLKKYAPNTVAIPLTGTGGNADYAYLALTASAQTIAGITTNGDDGTGKVLADYLVGPNGKKYIGWHLYGNQEKESTFYPDYTNNYISYRLNHFGMRLLMIAIESLTRFRSTAPAALLNTDFKDYAFWATESGMIEQYSQSLFNADPAVRWFTLTYEQRQAMSFKYFMTALMKTQDGNGQLGKLFMYECDTLSDAFTTGGNVLNIRNSGNGAIRIDVGSAPQAKDTPHIMNVAVSIANPCVVTHSNNPFTDGSLITLSTTSGGILPTGLTKGNTYYVRNRTASGYNLSSTPTGALIATTGPGSGTPQAYANTYFGSPALYITAGASGWADLGLAAGEGKWVHCDIVSNFINGVATFDIADSVFTAAPAGTQVFAHAPLRLGPYPEERKWFLDLVRGKYVTTGYIHYPESESRYPGEFWLIEDGVNNIVYYTKANGDLAIW